LFTYAAWADKYDGAVHSVPIRGVSIAMNEPIGVMGLVCDDAFPLLGLVSLIGPAMATGNTTIVVPSHPFPLAATDFYSVLETSDVPAGVVNIVTGDKNALAKVLAEHDDVDAIWYFGEREGVRRGTSATGSTAQWVKDANFFAPRRRSRTCGSRTANSARVRTTACRPRDTS
jgi:aldehyde dehydrogenase (NAD+)